MWPKALLQLIELAPHVTRLVPAADRYLQSRAENGKAQRRALDEMGERLRGELALTAERAHEELTGVSAAQVGLVQQLTQQGEALESLAADLRAARLRGEALDERMARLGTQMQRLWITLIVALVVFASVASGLILVLHGRH